MYSFKRSAITVVATLSLLTCGLSAQPEPSALSNPSATIVSGEAGISPLTVTSDAKVTFDRVDVTTIKAPEPVIVPVEVPAVEAPVAIPAEQATASPTPAVNEVVTTPPAVETPVAPVSDGTIYVGLSGFQPELDLCQGPVFMTRKPTRFGNAPYIAEHDFCGGWERFGNLNQGDVISFSGNLNGTYRITGKDTVTKPSVSKMVKLTTGQEIYIQTCIPGTDYMVIHHGVRVS